MGIIEAIKKGFGVATKSMGLVIVLFVFNLIFNMISIPLAVTPGTVPSPQTTSAALIFSIIFILASVFIQGGTLGLVRDYIKEGKMKLNSLASYGLKYYMRLFVLGALIILIITVVALIASLIVTATTPLNNTVITVLASIIAIIIGGVGLYYILLLVMAPYSIVCDETGIIESMKKSLKLVRKVILKVILLILAIILISLGIGFIVGFLTGIATVAMPARGGQVVIGIVNSLLNGYLGIVMTAAFMGFYLSLEGKTA